MQSKTETATRSRRGATARPSAASSTRELVASDIDAPSGVDLVLGPDGMYPVVALCDGSAQVHARDADGTWTSDAAGACEGDIQIATPLDPADPSTLHLVWQSQADRDDARMGYRTAACDGETCTWQDSTEELDGKAPRIVLDPATERPVVHAADAYAQWLYNLDGTWGRTQLHALSSTTNHASGGLWADDSQVCAIYGDYQADELLYSCWDGDALTGGVLDDVGDDMQSDLLIQGAVDPDGSLVVRHQHLQRHPASRPTPPTPTPSPTSGPSIPTATAAASAASHSIPPAHRSCSRPSTPGC